MATSTLQNMRREFARFAGYYHLVGKDGAAWSTTTNVTTDTVLISTALRDAGFDDFGQAASGDNALVGLYSLLLGTNNDRFVRKIKQTDASAGSLTNTGVVYSAESGSVDFEIHRFHPNYIKDKINDARKSIYPLLHLPVTRYVPTAQQQIRYDVPVPLIDGPDRIYLYRGIPVAHANNVLINGDFQDFTANVPDSWAATTLDTLEEVPTTSPVNFATLDGSSVRCTSQSGNTGTLLQTMADFDSYSGQRITFQVWVYCVTPSIVSTQITINGVINLGDNTDGGLHHGNGWELLTHFEDAPVTLTSLIIGISVVSTATDNSEFYVDSGVAVIGPHQEPETDPIELFGWEYREDNQGTTVRQEVVFRGFSGGFGGGFPNNSLLRFEGKAYLSAVLAETDVMEIGKPQTDLLYAQMAKEMLNESSQFVADANREYILSQLAVAAARYEDLLTSRMREPLHRLGPPW